VFTHTNFKHYVNKTFYSCLETICIDSFADVGLHQIILCSNFMCFSQTSIFPPLFNALVWQWLVAVVAGVLSCHLFFLAFCTCSISYVLAFRTFRTQPSVCFIVSHNFVFSKKWLGKTFGTLIKTIYMLWWTSSSDDFSHLLHNLMLKCLQFTPTAGLLFDDEQMQL